MPRNIRTITLVTKRRHTASSALAQQIIAWLGSRGVRATVADLESAGKHNDSDELLQSDLVLVVGGDGTTIRAARRLVGRDIPLVGVNMGRVGFLPELSVNNWQEHLSRALEGELVTERRMALEFCILQGGQTTVCGHAVNDVAISRGGMARLVAMNLSVDGSKLLYLRADGLILATPTGATAYASSAGGPLLFPTLDVYSVTAICPFISHILPMVLGAEATLRVEVCEACTHTFATVDGQELYRLKAGDALQVRGMPGGILFGRFGVSGYFDKLRNSGFMYDSPGNTPREDS